MAAETPRAIADRLTEVERKAVLWLPTEGRRYRKTGGRNQPTGTTMLRLCFTHHIANMNGADMWGLNVTGLLVRAELSKEPGHE